MSDASDYLNSLAGHSADLRQSRCVSAETEVIELTARIARLEKAATAVLNYFDFTGGDPDDSDANERSTELWGLATAAEELTRAALFIEGGGR